MGERRFGVLMQNLIYLVGERRFVVLMHNLIYWWEKDKSSSMCLLSSETNLKVKQCLDVTNSMGEDESSLSQFSGHILCEAPNNNLGILSGYMNILRNICRLRFFYSVETPFSTL